jgi:adenylate cyclase
MSAESEHLENRVKLRLLMAGVPPEELEHLDQDLALELLRTRILWGDDEPITITELAARTGLEVEVCRRARMLLGLPDPGDEPLCRVQEVETFRGFAAGMELYGEDTILQFTRVLGGALATVAEGALSVFARRLTERPDGGELVGNAYVLEAFDALESFQIVPDVLRVVAKLQFEQAVHRLTADPGQPQWSAIGFVDLTDSTRSTEQLGAEVMAEALTRFEEWSVELAVAAGGRVVKYIGDEVMFLAPDLPAAAGVASELIARVAADPQLGSARAGAAYGPLLSRDGDWYGTTVNLAARLVEKAKAGTVWLTGEGAEQVEGATPMRGRRKLRDVPQRVEVWRLG